MREEQNGSNEICVRQRDLGTLLEQLTQGRPDQLHQQVRLSALLLRPLRQINLRLQGGGRGRFDTQSVSPISIRARIDFRLNLSLIPRESRRKDSERKKYHSSYQKRRSRHVSFDYETRREVYFLFSYSSSSYFNWNLILFNTNKKHVTRTLLRIMNTRTRFE